MRRTVELLAQRVERRSLKRAPVLPAALVRLARTHADAIERRSETKPVQDTHRIGRHVDAAADLGQLRGLFIDVHLEAGLPQCECGAEAADTSADDADAKHGDDRLFSQIARFSARTESSPRESPSSSQKISVLCSPINGARAEIRQDEPL